MYSEQVSIQQGKQFIVLEGESSRTTVISWEAGGSVTESAAFTMLADNFVARNITFKVYSSLIDKTQLVQIHNNFVHLKTDH